MSIASHYTKTVITQRLTDVGGDSKRQRFTVVNAALVCAIHAQGAEEAPLSAGGFYQSFKMYAAPTTDIEIGDRVIDGSDTYTVQGKQLFDDMGGSSNEHVRLTLQKGK